MITKKRIRFARIRHDFLSFQNKNTEKSTKFKNLVKEKGNEYDSI